MYIEFYIVDDGMCFIGFLYGNMIMMLLLRYIGFGCLVFLLKILLFIFFF